MPPTPDEIGLHEAQRVAPRLAGEIAHRIEPPVDRIVAQMLGRPGRAQPALLVGRDRDDLPDLLVVEIELRQDLQRLDQAQADIVHVVELLAHRRASGRSMTRMASRYAVVLVDHAVGEGIGLQPLGDAGKCRIGHVVRGAPDAAFERGPRQAQGFGRTEDRTHRSSAVEAAGSVSRRPAACARGAMPPGKRAAQRKSRRPVQEAPAAQISAFRAAISSTGCRWSIRSSCRRRRPCRACSRAVPC